MEEVPAHVHPGPIVPNILSRQHEYRSGLIWSRDHETCFTDLQCRRFGRNLFQCCSTITGRLAVVHGSFRGCTTDRESLSLTTDLGVIAYTCIVASADYGCSSRLSCSSCQLPMHTLVTYMDQLDFMPSDQIVEYHYPGRVIRQFAWAQMVPDACDTRLDLHRIYDEYIRWYRGITQVYIGNIPNRDTRSYGYQPAGVDKWMMIFMLQEVDDIASVVIQKLPTDPSEMAVFTKKVQMIIWRFMTFPVQTSRHRPREHIPDQSGRRQPGRGAGGGRPPIPPFPDKHEQVYPRHAEFRTPFPLGTADSSTPHQPISQTSSSDEEERTNDMDGVQQYGFWHRVGKKTTRFTPSDWP
ncbi:hypothetical protein M9H77_27995 [Catharanthus roseus]|uniref:Uncharacterized protein n=1 Tax=Catharanthus roseus TaxID=4058 RepID=A0ACC0AE25_CATRO|nr:hypothetical protein M9H77_27995 [Catharanthus roseus]